MQCANCDKLIVIDHGGWVHAESGLTRCFPDKEPVRLDTATLRMELGRKIHVEYSLAEDDFDHVLTRAVELADGEDGWREGQGHMRWDENSPVVQTPVLRCDVTTYEGSRYRVVIMGPFDD